jgi:hypothetical protein
MPDKATIKSMKDGPTLEELFDVTDSNGRKLRYLEIAYNINLAEATIRNWIKGRAIPTLNVFELKVVLDFLKVTFDEFEAATRRTYQKKLG